MRLMTTLALAAMLATPTLAQNRIDGLRPDAPEFAAPGDYRVGVTTLVLTNPGQIDTLHTMCASARGGDADAAMVQIPRVISPASSSLPGSGVLAWSKAISQAHAWGRPHF